jgi:tricorn protease
MAVPMLAQQTPLWMRYPAISPDGKSIVFSYKGDLYKVNSSGGDAYPLTLHEAHDYMPVWSRDGKWVAFASDRYGNFDVYVMPAAGGEAKRLTFHSANDVPYVLTPTANLYSLAPTGMIFTLLPGSRNVGCSRSCTKCL